MIVDLPARHRTRYNQICEIQALVLRRGGRVESLLPVPARQTGRSVFLLSEIYKLILQYSN